MGQLLGTGPSVPVVATYPQHPVTENFNLLTAFPLAQSVKGEAGVELGTANTENVINTSDRSWSESDVKSLASGRQGFAGRSQPAIIADRSRSRCRCRWTRPTRPPPRLPRYGGQAGRQATKPAEAPKKPQMRIMVVGDSDFASNAAAGIQGNADLFVNMNNWLTQQEDLISIHPRDAGDRRVTMTADQQRRVVWLSLLFIPGPHSRIGRLHLVAEALNGTHSLDADPAGRRARSRRLSLLRRFGAARCGSGREEDRSSRTTRPRSIRCRSSPAAAR